MIHFIDLKYGDKEALTAQLSDFAREHGAWDYVIHNAGLTKTLDKRNFFRVNAENTHRFIEALAAADKTTRSEEHTSELQSPS